MSVDGRIIADVQRLHTLGDVTLFLLVTGSRGAGKSTALRAVAGGLTSSTSVATAAEVSTLADLLPPVDGAEAGDAGAFTVCRVTYGMLADGSARAADALRSASQLRRHSVLIVDDVDVLWMLCCANRRGGRLQRLLDVALSTPACALVVSALSTDAVPPWLLGRKMPVTYPLRDLTAAGVRRLLRAVPQPSFKAHSEDVLSTQTLSSSRSMLLFNACMTLHSAAQGVAPAQLGAQAAENGAFLHHRRDPTEGGQRPQRALFGVEEVRHRLHTLLAVFVAHSNAGAGGKLMASLPSSTGVLLHGPSGCGKSSLTQQLAADFPAVPFFVVECTRLFSKFLGQSEEQLREVYRRARLRAPAVVVLEDIDVIAQSRGALAQSDGGGGGRGGLDVTKRMLAGLLCELDGVTDNSGVLTIGVTNAPHVLDAAVLRQGRLETMLRIPPLTEDGALAMSDDFFQNFEGPEEARRACCSVVAARAVGCAAASLQYVLRKVLEQAVGQAGWAAAEGGSLPLPAPATLHGLLFEHCAMLRPVTHVHFE